MSKRILIVDDDPWIRRMVGTVLERRSYQVDTASDGREGLEKALAGKPDLIITDVLMPKMDGWAFVRALRSNPEMALIPVIFLTALAKEEDRILGFRLGADDYLAKPFRFEELDLRVEKVMRLASRLQQNLQRQRQEEGMPGFRGDLAQLGVSSVLTVMEMERKSGVVVLESHRRPSALRASPARTGRVFMREGRVLAASFDEDPSKRGADAVFEMLTWKEGSFHFTSLEVVMEDQIGTSTTHLLMEGARRIDELAAGVEAERSADLELEDDLAKR
jgi:DNA-binding response OmpR family regulator